MASDSVWFGWIGILQALTLADGIVGEHDESIAREDRGEDASPALPLPVAGSHEDRRRAFRRARAIRNIQQRGYIEIGLAFKEHFANAKSFGRRFSHDLCVERRALGKCADEGENLAAHFGLACLSLCRVWMAATAVARFASTCAAELSRTGRVASGPGWRDWWPGCGLQGLRFVVERRAAVGGPRA